MSMPKIGFELRKVRLPLAAIRPVREIKESQKGASRYRMIVNTLKEVALIEPLMVYPQQDGTFLLLDGHLRYCAMKDSGETEAECILAKEDESYTYNARVNRLNPIQENKMITLAVQNGVRPERIAAALDVPVRVVQAAISLMNGIHEEAADLLKDKCICSKAVRLLKRVTGVRQIEIAELMVSTNNYTAGYAEALILATPKDQLAVPEEPKKKKGMSAEDIARMEEELAGLQRDLKAVEQSYGENVLTLTVSRGYIKKLLENAKVVRFLKGQHPEILSEFEAVAAAEAL
jgi:ParB-like chromosome segregation protein Spo0J